MTVTEWPTLAARNEKRAAEGASRNAELAGQALAWAERWEGDRIPYAWIRVASARRAHPNDSWARIAERLGMTKYAAASAFRRFLVAAGLAGNGPGRWGG